MAAKNESSPTNPVDALRKAARSRATVEDRMAAGKALRKQVPRESHAAWSPTVGRPDPVALLQAEDVSRIPELLPVRYGRVSASPFTFLRGSAIVMANDLAATPATGLIVQACGDAHLSNFGGYGTPERNLVFDLNDFDESLPAPWEWDVKRLAASIIVASRDNGFQAADAANSARAAVRSYRERMAMFAPMSYLDVWYTRINAADAAANLPKAAKKRMERTAKKAVHRNNLQALAKMTVVVDGEIRIADDPPIIVHHTDQLVGDHLPEMATAYRSSLHDEISELLSRYSFVDSARKAVGVGSVGTRCYIVLMQGNHDQDPLFLQIKEAGPSVLEPFAGKSTYGNHGQRVVHGQRQTQAASDIFLGWGSLKGIDFYVRQLRDMKVSAEVSLMEPEQLSQYAGLCGWALARAHARTGDPALIAGYLGGSDAFDEAIVTFAIAYADQTERDHGALMAAIKSGKVTAQSGL